MSNTFEVGNTFSGWGFTVDSENHLVYTVDPAYLNICDACPNVHIVVLQDGTPENIRLLAQALLRWCDRLEHVQ